MDYVTWTYFFRRLIMNPSYYHLDETTTNAVNKFLSDVVTNALTDLKNSYCIFIEEVSTHHYVHVHIIMYSAICRMTAMYIL